MVSGSSGRVAEWIRVIMRSENLEELPEQSVDLERTSFFSKLMKSENLPLDEAAAMVPRVPHGSGIFASEPLPSDDLPEPHGGRASFIATLFSREPLPADPAPGPRPVGRGFGR